MLSTQCIYVLCASQNIIIIYLSWSWVTCWPVPVSPIQKSLQRSTMIPSASWGVVFQQTMIISLYNINWLVYITEMECVYCAVRSGSLNVIQINLSRRRLRRGARVSTRSAHVWFVVDRVALGYVSIRVLRFSFVSIIPPLLHTHLQMLLILTRTTNRRRLGTIQNPTLLLRTKLHARTSQKPAIAVITSPKLVTMR